MKVFLSPISPVRALGDSGDRLLNTIFVDGNLDFDLLDEAADFLGAPIHLGNALLAAPAEDIGNRQQVDLDLLQGRLDILQFMGLMR